MHIISATVAFCLAVAIDGASADPRFRAQPLWGIVPNGGESSTPEENTDRKMTTSEQILNSVSAGGGSPGDAETTAALTSAFVGSAKSPVHAAATLKRPSVGSSTPTSPSELATTSSLSVATNQQKSGEEAIETIPAVSEDKKTVEEEQKNPTDDRKKGPLKILFLSSDTGGGHRASAEALANQFQRLFPGTTYDLMDTWTDVASSWPYYTIKETYKSFSASPWKWKTLYHVSNNAIYAKFADYHSYYMNEDMIREKMETYNPDVVVSVHPTMNYVPLFSIRKISKKLGKGQ
jgi:1,2-diacylglycerol 3-beta-galactosyltransferase